MRTRGRRDHLPALQVLWAARTEALERKPAQGQAGAGKAPTVGRNGGGSEPMHNYRLSRRTLGIVGLSLPFARGAAAQDAYPTRPVRMVVPFAAGGSTDILARLIAQQLSNRLEQQFIVDNKPGAGTNIAAEFVVKSRPDGYTLLFGAAAMATNPSLVPSMPYDMFRDLAPIAVIGRTPLVLVVHPSVPARSVQELLALARSRPGGLNAATGGNGTIPH